MTTQELHSLIDSVIEAQSPGLASGGPICKATDAQLVVSDAAHEDIDIVLNIHYYQIRNDVFQGIQDI